MPIKKLVRGKPWRVVVWVVLCLAALSLLAGVVFQYPPVQARLGWRLDFAMAYVRGVIDPIKPLPAPRSLATENPTALPAASARIWPTVSPLPSATSLPTFTPTVSPTAIPRKIELQAPVWEKQEANNCGPTTLAMYLRYFGWSGTQATIASIVKPKSEDRNVNVEELTAYVNSQVAGLEGQYRVGGDITLLKQLLAAGEPVMIEETFFMEESYWPNDDRWAGHYLLLTGYDDEGQIFTGQDSFLGSDQQISYATLDEHWKAFNRVYILVFSPERRPVLQSVLGAQWEVSANRQHALEVAQAEKQANPQDAFAWFNQGTNLVYFEKYGQAAVAYDRAREIGLPQRMLRYQFGPFFAYFNINRYEDLLDLAQYALKITPNSEEAMLWRGWALYRKGDPEAALKLFQQALDARPGYVDAEYALQFVQDH